MSPIVHSGIALLGWQKSTGQENKHIKTLLIFLLISNLPDIDFLFFLVIGKKAFAMHQYYTHNVFFVAVFPLLFFPILKQKGGGAPNPLARPWGLTSLKTPSQKLVHFANFHGVLIKRERMGLYLTAFSHLLLDLATIDGGAPLGFRLFYPLSEKLFYFGFFPNLHKKNLEEVFSFHNLWVLAFETAVFLLPVLFYYRKEFGSYLILIKQKEFWR